MTQTQDIDLLRPDQLDDAIRVILAAFDSSYEESARFELGWSLTADASPYRPVTFAASHEGRVAGIIQCAMNYAHPDTYSLGWVAVDPASQGRGIGRRMVRHAEDHIARIMLRGRPGTILIVDDTRIKRPASTYYLDMGYADGPLTHRAMHVMVKTVNS